MIKWLGSLKLEQKDTHIVLFFHKKRMRTEFDKYRCNNKLWYLLRDSNKKEIKLLNFVVQLEGIFATSH